MKPSTTRPDNNTLADRHKDVIPTKATRSDAAQSDKSVDMNDEQTAVQTRVIASAYEDRKLSVSAGKYSFFMPDLRLALSQREWVLANFFRKHFRGELSDSAVLDIGCGTGELLSTLCSWGADPAQLVGTEFLEDRLRFARAHGPTGITWHQGDLRPFENDRFQLICLCTVLSSILDSEARQTLINEATRVLSPGGWIMVFDFHYNNPSNQDVRKVTRSELESLIGTNDQKRHFHIKTGLLPPLSRRITPYSYVLAQIVSALLPFTRSHFVHFTQVP